MPCFSHNCDQMRKRLVHKLHKYGRPLFTNSVTIINVATGLTMVNRITGGIDAKEYPHCFCSPDT